MISPFSRAAGVLVMAVVGALALASEPFQKAAQPGDEDALAGPMVVDRTKVGDQPSLMQSTFDGSTEDLRERAEIAALRLMVLSPQEREATDKLLDTRAMRIGQLLGENYDQFLELHGLLQGMLQNEKDQPAGMSRNVRDKVLAMRDKAIDLVEPPLLDQIAIVLSTENAAKLREIVREYVVARPALVAPNARLRARPVSPRQNMTSNGMNGMDGIEQDTITNHEQTEQSPATVAVERDSPPRNQAMSPWHLRRYETGQLLRELGRAFAAIIDERKDRFDRLIEVAQPTAEQEAKLQLIVRDLGVQGSLKPTPQQRSETFRKIMDVLTPEQRQRVREAIR